MNTLQKTIGLVICEFYSEIFVTKSTISNSIYLKIDNQYGEEITFRISDHEMKSGCCNFNFIISDSNDANIEANKILDCMHASIDKFSSDIPKLGRGF